MRFLAVLRLLSSCPQFFEASGTAGTLMQRLFETVLVRDVLSNQ